MDWRDASSRNARENWWRLETAIRSRDVIGQAKGVVMALRRLTAPMAFELLKRLSQARNVKLRDLAREVTETGDLP